MRFYIVFRDGRKSFAAIVAPDADVAVFLATKRLGLRNVSHAVKA